MTTRAAQKHQTPATGDRHTRVAPSTDRHTHTVKGDSCCSSCSRGARGSGGCQAPAPTSAFLVHEPARWQRILRLCTGLPSLHRRLPGPQPNRPIASRPGQPLWQQTRPQRANTAAAKRCARALLCSGGTAASLPAGATGANYWEAGPWHPAARTKNYECAAGRQAQRHTRQAHPAAAHTHWKGGERPAGKHKAQCLLAQHPLPIYAVQANATY